MADELLKLRLSAGNYDVDSVGLSSSDVLACNSLWDVIQLSPGCSLDMHPGGSNWVEKNGGLPNYICEIAKSILEGGGKTVSQAIAIAVSRVKVWAAGGDGVKPDTRAKAAAAVAEWQKLKGKAHKK